MERRDNSQRSSRSAVTQPMYPPPLFQTEKQLTAPADRPLRHPAHTVAFTTAVGLGGASSVHRRTGMQTARALPVDRNRSGSPPATDCQQNPPPAFPVNHALDSLTTVAARHPDVRKKEVKMILKEPARARGVSWGEPGKSHAARAKKLTQTGRPRLAGAPAVRASE